MFLILFGFFNSPRIKSIDSKCTYSTFIYELPIPVNLVDKLADDTNTAIENQAKKVEALGTRADEDEQRASNLVEKIGKCCRTKTFRKKYVLTLGAHLAKPEEEKGTVKNAVCKN